MIESNLVNLKQDIGLLGASKKLQKGNTGLPVRRQTGKKQGQMIPFLCMMGQICRITTQETEKTNQPLPVKGRGAKTNRSLPGKINLLSEKGGQKQTGAGKAEVGGQPPAHRGLRPGGRAEMADAPGLMKFSLKNAVVVKGKSTAESAMTEKNTEKNSFIPVKSGGKNDIGNLLKHLGLKGEAKAVVGKDEVGGQPPAHRGLRPGGRAEMADAPGLMKFSLKNAVVVKGKSAVEHDSTGKNSFTPVKSGGKNDIGNPLKPLGLKGEEVAVEHEKTGVKEFTDHKIGILHRGIPRPARPSDRGFSAGGYQHTAFHADSGSAVINESVNSYDIEPRALINQIANSVKKPGRVRITLNPPRLGTLDVDVLVRDNKVHVILQTENNDVRQILQSNVESLKSSLRNQGLVADTINVSVQEKPDGGNYGSGRNETLFREGGNREGNEEDHGGEQDSLNHDPSSLKEENPSVRSDGRVSLFA